MPTILVVDDSIVDRQLVEGLLKVDDELRVEYAVNGEKALEKMASSTPDLVVTDLIMPQMDGLQFVAAVKEAYSEVPVILMTSRGSEEIAVKALQQGAASYVPKQTLSGNLLETVRSVLAVSCRRRSHSRLMCCMTENHCAFELENDSSLFGPLVTYLQEQAARLGLCDATQRTRIGVALEEALCNALFHGNLALDSELRERDDAAYRELLEKRRNEPPYRDRRIRVEAHFSREESRFIVRDEGSGFNPSALPNPVEPANLEKVSGRGVLLMRTFMDDVSYNETGNVVTMLKRCDSKVMQAAHNGT